MGLEFLFCKADLKTFNLSLPWRLTIKKFSDPPCLVVDVKTLFERVYGLCVVEQMLDRPTAV